MSIELPQNSQQWIFDQTKPGWDQYFMAMVFLVAMRSPDQETKQGCVIVDWPSKTVMATGYNGHPRNAVPYCDQGNGPIYHPNDIKQDVAFVEHAIPTTRPDKYPFMVHADTNAVANVQGTSDHAVVYLPMPPCEVCLGVMANMSRVRIRRIVYLEHRHFPRTEQLARHLPHIKFEQYLGPDPTELLSRAAMYTAIRQAHGKELSRESVATYADSLGGNEGKEQRAA